MRTAGRPDRQIGQPLGFEYRYDAFDRLIARFDNTDGSGPIENKQYFLYDAAPGKGGNDDVVLVYDENGNVIDRYLHGPAVDQLFADESAVDGLLWALADRQGSIRDWADYDAGTDTTSVYDHVIFDSFGNIQSQSNPSHKITIAYTARYRDPATGLQWNRARWYDPGTGRWISEDPIGFNSGQVNLSAYARNSPTNTVDPSGFESLTTDDLDEYLRDKGIISEDDNQNEINQKRGQFLEDWFKRATGFPKNTRKFTSPKRPSPKCIPDFVRLGGTGRARRGLPPKLKVFYDRFWIETKAVSGTIILSTEKHQPERFIDALANGKWAKYSPPFPANLFKPNPTLLYVTTADTKLSPAILAYARKAEVTVCQAELWVRRNDAGRIIAGFRDPITGANVAEPLFEIEGE